MKLLVHNLRRCFRRYVCCCCCCCCARAEEESLYANGGSSGSGGSDVLGAGAGSFGKGLAKMRSKRRGRTNTATVVELAAAKDAIDGGVKPGKTGAAAPPLAALSPGHSEASLKSPEIERPANVTAAREAAQAAIDPDAWADS